MNYHYQSRKDEVTVYDRFGEVKVIYRDELKDFLNHEGFKTLEESRNNHKQVQERNNNA